MMPRVGLEALSHSQLAEEKGQDEAARRKAQLHSLPAKSRVGMKGQGGEAPSHLLPAQVQN